MCLDQLKFSGVFEAVKIRKQGFPFRFPHRTFAFRYHCCLPTGTISLSAGDDHAICQKILVHCLQKRGLGTVKSFQVGNTMCLYRASEHRMLELLRSLALESVVPHIQRTMRGLFAREMRRRLVTTTATIEHALGVGNDAVLLGNAIENVAETIGASLVCSLCSFFSFVCSLSLFFLFFSSPPFPRSRSHVRARRARAPSRAHSRARARALFPSSRAPSSRPR